MRNRKHGLDEREIQLVKLLMSECKTKADIQSKSKRIFAGTIEQMLEADMCKYLGYENNSIYIVYFSYSTNIKYVGAKLIYLLSYSPDFNTIE